MQGLGNEIPFFICPYSPSLHVELEQMRRQLVNQLRQNGIIIQDVNLYDLSVHLLRERGIWDKVLSVESTLDKTGLKELLQNVLDPEAHLIPQIAMQIERDDYHAMFLSGVGEIFPFIRSHTVLNNLQSSAKLRPTIMFFPGTYTHSATTGASLDLFGRLRDDKYYRAFNILHYSV